MLRRVPLLARPASRCGEPLPPFVLAESYTHAATITGLCRPTIRLHAGPTPARCHCETLHSAGVLAPEAERFKELLKAQYKGAINELSIGACEPCVILTGFHNFATSEPISRVVYELLIYMLKHRLEHLEWWLPHGPSATGVPDGKPAFPIRARKRPDGSCEFQARALVAPGCCACAADIGTTLTCADHNGSGCHVGDGGSIARLRARVPSAAGIHPRQRVVRRRAV
jgi:hypothetical protein